MKPNLRFLNQLPKITSLSADSLVIYDERLPRLDLSFAKWLQTVPCKYAVRSGEQLKDVDQFPKHIRKIFQLVGNSSVKNFKVIAVGGGTVGDFAGFIASVFKRGVPVIHVPSTWLAAIDSAHGGKTGLNVLGAKNQIGSFHQAEQILFVKSLLLNQPEERAFEASSELLKIALLVGGQLWKNLSAKKTFNAKVIWQLLPLAVDAKYKIVQLDPTEKNGRRYLLNLGHSMGHAFETIFHFPHGIAVMCGLEFSILYSQNIGLMSQKNFDEMNDARIWQALIDFRKRTKWRNLNYPALLLESEKTYLKALHKDKKKQSKKMISFVFLKSPGRPVIKNVLLEELVNEIRHQRRVLS